MTAPDPQPPVWNGQGVDPWLPARLDAALAAAAAERAVRADLWSRLSEWIVSVRRGVLAHRRPDPFAVYAHQPQWTAAVRHVVDGPITHAIGTAHRELLGDGYPFDGRPAVVEHLSTVTNRLARVPDEVYGEVASAVARGAEAGESIPEIAHRVDVVLSETDTPRWPNRATVIARTETLSALNTGRNDAFGAVAEELEQPFEKQWLATIDGATRPTHSRADGQRVPLDGSFLVGGAHLRYPGDPAGPGKEVIQCRCTTLLLEPGEDVDLSHRQFANY